MIYNCKMTCCSSVVWLANLLIIPFITITVVVAGQPNFIEVDPHSVVALRERGTARPYVAVGINYFSPHIGWAPKIWQQFDEKMVAEHLDLLHDHGFNTIRVFLTYDGFHREPGIVHSEGEAKFRKLLALCRSRGMRVIPSGPDHWEGMPGWRAKEDRFASEKILEADEKWWSAFTVRFKDEPTILAWDLYNEPSIRWDTPAMRPKWNDWLKREYGSQTKIAAAWSMPSESVGSIGSIDVPQAKLLANDQRLYDYQRFREFIANEWARRLTSAIRQSDSNHLITIGYVQWISTSLPITGVQYYAGFDIRSNAQYLDFVSIHLYPLGTTRPDLSPEGIPINAADFERLLFECSVGKPIMIGEFGWYGGGDIRINDKPYMNVQTVEDQLAWCKALLDVSRGRVCGWLNWALADTPTSTDLTRWSGLWTEDMQLKPWGKLFSDFAHEVTSQPQRLRPFPDDFDRQLPDRRIMLTDPVTGYREKDAERRKSSDQSVRTATQPG